MVYVIWGTICSKQHYFPLKIHQDYTLVQYYETESHVSL